VHRFLLLCLADEKAHPQTIGSPMFATTTIDVGGAKPFVISAKNQSEKDAKLAQKLGQLQPFTALFPPECMGQVASSGPNLTPFALKARVK
jgi:hypothetical protein